MVQLLFVFLILSVILGQPSHANVEFKCGALLETVKDRLAIDTTGSKYELNAFKIFAEDNARELYRKLDKIPEKIITDRVRVKTIELPGQYFVLRLVKSFDGKKDSYFGQVDYDESLLNYGENFDGRFFGDKPIFPPGSAADIGLRRLNSAGKDVVSYYEGKLRMMISSQSEFAKNLFYKMSLLAPERHREAYPNSIVLDLFRVVDSRTLVDDLGGLEISVSKQHYEYVRGPQGWFLSEVSPSTLKALVDLPPTYTIFVSLRVAYPR